VAGPGGRTSKRRNSMNVDMDIVKELELAKKQIQYLENEITIHTSNLYAMREALIDTMAKNRNLEMENNRLQGLVDGLTHKADAAK
jgi:regulator of replication initiation timing